MDLIKLFTKMESWRNTFHLLVMFYILTIYGHTQACPMGYYGYQCLTPCSKTCVSMECDAQTGACLGGCKEGYYGDRCAQTCGKGTYGSNCSMNCSTSCVNQECDPTSGQCLKCEDGYIGPRCDQECFPGFYGDGCRTRCPANCASPQCNHQSGYCLRGCKPGFWGSDCSLPAELIGKNEPSRRQFYNHLSAESRSVILYVLMSQYESSLERAQIEINSGLNIRKQIQQMIGRA